MTTSIKIPNPKLRCAAIVYLAVEGTGRWLLGASIISSQPRGTWQPSSGITLPPVGGSVADDLIPQEVEAPRSFGG